VKLFKNHLVNRKMLAWSGWFVIQARRIC